MVRLSIIIPFYNVEQYIAQCLDSVYQQDIPEEEYEVICVNDASPDGSRVIVKEYQKKHKNLILVEHERNKKLGGARNTGIRAARGTYVLFVDSDDLIVKNSFGRLLNAMSDGSEYIHFGHFVLKDSECTEVRSFPTTEQTTGPELFLNGQIPWNEQVVAWNKIYRLEFLRKNNLYFAEDIMYEDNDFAMRLSAAASNCRHINDACYIYRSNENSITGQKVNPERLMYWQKTWSIITELLDSIGKQDVRYDKLIRGYMRQDLFDVLNNLYQLPQDQRSKVIHNLTIKEWLRFVRFLPIKRRVEYLYKLIKA